MEFHPAANLFPLIEGAEFDALVADIKTNGLHNPVVLTPAPDELILDGRNRYRACIAAGIAFRATRYDGPTDVDTLTSWVLSQNLQRRHLTESQRAMVAAHLANLKNGHRPVKSPPISIDIGGPEDDSRQTQGVTRMESSRALNVGVASVNRAARVIKEAPHLVSAIESGAITVGGARKILDETKEVQEQALADVKEGKARTLEEAVRIARGQPSRVARGAEVKVSAVSVTPAPIARELAPPSFPNFRPTSDFVLLPGTEAASGPRRDTWGNVIDDIPTVKRGKSIAARFASILIDPPQSMVSRPRQIEAARAFDQDQLAKLPIPNMLNENAAMVALVARPVNFQGAVNALSAWGLRIVNVLTMTYPLPQSIENEWLQEQTEHVILAARGCPYPRNRESQLNSSHMKISHTAALPRSKEFYEWVSDLLDCEVLDYFATINNQSSQDVSRKP